MKAEPYASLIAEGDDKTCWRCGYKVSGSICAMCGAVNKTTKSNLSQVPFLDPPAELIDSRAKTKSTEVRVMADAEQLNRSQVLLSHASQHLIAAGCHHRCCPQSIGSGCKASSRKPMASHVRVSLPTLTG